MLEKYRKKVQFIRDYEKAKNAASGSKYDANANVENKNITTLSGELPKEDMIGINRLMMYDSIKELFDEDTANEYLRQLGDHEIYKHDETSIKPYTYGAHESVIVIYKGVLKLVSLSDLYSLCEEPEELLDEAKEVYGKCPIDLYIADKRKPTQIIKLIKKKRHRDLVRVKINNGEDIIVTDNHPLIVTDDINSTVSASESNGYCQYKISFPYHMMQSSLDSLPLVTDGEDYGSYVVNKTDTTKHYSHRYAKLTEEFGYFVGFFIAEGWYDTYKNHMAIMIKQKDRRILIKCADYLYRTTGIYSHVTSCADNREFYCLKVTSATLVDLFINEFNISPNAQNKKIPIHILNYNDNFKRGVISGIVDGNGTVDMRGRVSIRLSSRTCISQLKSLLTYMNIKSSMTYYDGTTNNNPDKLIQSSYPMFGISFHLDETFSLCEKTKYRINRLRTVVNVDNSWCPIEKIQPITNEKYLESNDYIYDITTVSHTFNLHGLWVHNCVSITMYPFLFFGLEPLGGASNAPTHTDSFAGSFINLVFAIAAQFAGAVSTPEFLTYLDYFLRKDYGEDYISNSDKVIDLSNRKATIDKKITGVFEQVIYSINQPAAARDYQSVFWNIAYFDEPYFGGIFKDFIFPDGTEPNWETVSWLQKRFMKWLNGERLRKLLTFPVETVNLLDDKKKYVDEVWADYVAQMWSEGHSFFTYRSSSVDSLASCCFDGSQLTLTKSSKGVNFMSFKDLYESSYTECKRNFTVFHNGSWVQGKAIRLPKRDLYKITTANKKIIYVTDNHINPTLIKDKETMDLTCNDYLLFNTRALESFPEQDQHLTYEQGILIGMYLGDGSMYQKKEEYTPQINLSLNQVKYETSLNNLRMAVDQITRTNNKVQIILHQPYNNVYPVAILNKEIKNFIREYVTGGYCYDKQLNMNCLLQSKEFRQGILDGYYLTDGGNSNRIYTVSEKLVYQIETLITSLGLNTTIDVCDRTDEKVVIRGEEFNRNYPLFCIRWYSSKNKRSMGNVYKIHNNSVYFKITGIEKINSSDEYVYCFAMANEEEPYFTLPNGIITHNCRLRNEVSDTTFSFTLGAGGVSTGSKGVITININRLVQNAVRDGIDISDAVRTQVAKVHKYLIAYENIIQGYFKANLLTAYDAGYISLDKQFLTIGINGFVEGAEFLGIEISPNEAYFNYGKSILQPMYEMNKAAKTKDLMFNTEYVPKMCGHKVA